MSAPRTTLPGPLAVDDPAQQRVNALLDALGFNPAPVAFMRNTGPGSRSWNKGKLFAYVFAQPRAAEPWQREQVKALADAAPDAVAQLVAELERRVRDRAASLRRDADAARLQAGRLDAAATALEAVLGDASGGAS